MEDTTSLLQDTIPFFQRLEAEIDYFHFLDKEGVALKIIFTILIALIVFFVMKKWISVLVKSIVGKTKNTWDDILYEQRFFSKLSYLILPVTGYIVISFIHWEHVGLLRRIVDIWLIVTTLFIFITLLNSINKIYESYPVSKDRPITFFVQLIKLFLYTVAVVVVVSVLVGKSPEHLIVGLGAFAAVLLLIFKDSILGFVAGIQLMANDMIKIGDWIVMSQNNADGTVLEVNLYTVKVQNWDMTISTIPTYQLVSDSFTNWRGMQESQGRRIKRSINIDIHSVHFLSHEEIEIFKASGFLKDYIDTMTSELGPVNKDKTTVLDERKLTNIGIFRQYMELWLDANPNINTNMTHMVRQLQPGPTGMPIEVYCFSAKQVWVEYEKVQSDIFDHIMAVIPQFNLRVFEYPGISIGEGKA